MDLKLGRIGVSAKIEDLTLNDLQDFIITEEQRIITYAKEIRGLDITGRDVECYTKGGKIHMYYDSE